ncbi:hypothetical protein D3C71_1130410 [compost metagenome]
MFDDRQAATLGRIPLAANVAAGVSIKDQRDVLEELPRIDVKADGSPRNAGKLWFAVHYRACGKPAAGTCWGW